MGAKEEKKFVKFLVGMGYESTARNDRRHNTIYSKYGKPDVMVRDCLDDHIVKLLTEGINKAHGVKTIKQQRKRNADQIKDRQARERMRLAAEIGKRRGEVADLLAQRNNQLNGLGKVLTQSEVAAISRLIEQHEREIREMQRLMQELPENNAHSGNVRAQHRS